MTGGFQSTLLLVSDSPKAMDFTLAIRGSLGQMLTAPETIQPQQKLSLDLASTITKLGGDPSGTFAQGSVAIYFTGTIMPIVGQISIRNPQLSLTHESEMVENDPGRSDIPAVLNGVWWGLGGGNQAQVMVSNTNDGVEMAQVYLDFQGQRHAIKTPLTFIPYETKVLDIAQLLASIGVDPAEAPEGGITIIQAGPNPALIANGKITDPATGFSSTMDFPLPQLERASALHATGLPIGTPTKDSPFAGAGNFIPHVVVRNLLTAPQAVTITVEYPVPSSSTDTAPAAPSPKPNFIPSPPMPGDRNNHPEWGAGTGSTTGSVVVGSFSVPAYSAIDYSLSAAMSQLPLPLPFCSIRIQYSGAPGSLEAEVSSVETTTQMVVDARVENEGNGWAGSGANPWHLDQNTESVLFLTNESAKTARITFSVTANGTHYFLTILRMQPHETRAINIRQLRDTQLADFRKNKIPAAATDGSVTWIRIDNLPVMGRLMVVERRGRMASSYDCCICPCPPDYWVLTSTPFYMTPSSATILSQGSVQFFVNVTYESCNGSDFYYEAEGDGDWTSSDTSVANVTGGYVTGVGGGQALISVYYSDCNDWEPVNQTTCTCGEYYSGTAGAWVTVQVPTKVVRYNSSCAAGGVGPLVTVSDGNILNCSGGVAKSGVDGAYRNLTYQVVDQNGSPIQPAYTVTEHFSNFSSTTSSLVEPQALSTSVPANGDFSDIQAVYYPYPAVLGPNDNASYQQSFVLSQGATQYNLSTVVSISLGKFNGTYEVNNSITTP